MIECISDNTYLKNFKHYLINEKHNSENELDSISSITIPACVLFITILLTYMFALINLGLFLNNKTEYISQLLMGVTIGTVFTAGIYFFIYLTNKRKKLFIKVKFFDDVISILERVEDQKKQTVT